MNTRLLITSCDPPFRIPVPDDKIAFIGKRTAVHRIMRFSEGATPVFYTWGWMVTHRVSGHGLVTFLNKRRAVRLAKKLEHLPELDYHAKSARTRRLKALCTESKRPEGYTNYKQFTMHFHPVPGGYQAAYWKRDHSAARYETPVTSTPQEARRLARLVIDAGLVTVKEI